MNKIICCVLDKTIGVHAHPFTSHNEGSAIRDFGHAVKDPASVLSKSPEDFTLIYLGTFDDETGVITPMQHKILAQASQFFSE